MKEIFITSSVLILCIMLIRLLFKGKISSRLQYALWLLVALRLIVPSSAQISMAVGSLEEFRIMDLVGVWEDRTGGLMQELNRPVSFSMSLNSPAGNWMAGVLLQDETSVIGSADGPTSVFLAGRIGPTILDVLRGIWIGGMIVTAVWMAAVNILFCHRLRRERREYVLPEEFRHLLQGKDIRIYILDGMTAPCLYGFPGREAIYLTPELIEHTDRLRHVLTHEICHKKHGDSFWSILRSILVSVYWINPFVWAAAALSKRDCELACDEAALLLLGEEERISYGETLLSIITRKGRLADLACTATTMTGSGKRVKERIQFIAREPKALGAAVVVLLIFVLALCVLVFTKNPEPVIETWGAGEVSIFAGDMQITLPETLAGICGYQTEDENGDLVVYQTASGQEAGRYCMLSYGTAVVLMEQGREIVPLGDYGQNPNLKQYMALMYDGYSYDMPTETTAHTYTPNTETEDAPATDHNYIQENEAASEPVGIPGTDSNEDGTTYLFEESEPYEAIPLEEPDKTDYLPNEEITVIRTAPFGGRVSDQCYVYLKADYSDVKEIYLEEMAYINSELEAAAGQVFLVSEYEALRKDMLAALAENRTAYLGDNSRVSALVNALPNPEGALCQGITLQTLPADIPALEVNYEVTANEGLEEDLDTMFFNAAMLFATIGNMEECRFIMDGEKVIVYTRDGMEEELGELWMEESAESERNYVKWLEDLYGRAAALSDGKQPY